ncbi:RNA-binding CRS1 / YhbY (CRM) domain protein [Rhynchospora pubera]|uniref:RNA-binding CRS1 / YhbY (CRM) domain protein n=1 Tax=Rhynchospora pubera TaxID=906938 RepID=A0AAV8BZJ1_9POAL|nr:RNA-binding CRS1 / YhbY (CRM) domain protein [Rhynchospora pubera]
MATWFLLRQSPRLRSLPSFSFFPLLSQALTSASSSLSSSNRVWFTPACCSSNTTQPFRPSSAQRYSTYESVRLVLSDGTPRFEIEEVEPSTKKKYLSKKRLKMKRKREKQKRKEANKNDPRRIRPKGKKRKEQFPTAASRLEYKIEKAKMKEAILIKKLKKYDVPQMHGPDVKPEDLTGEERFFLKKMAQKRSNYVPVGRRGVFGGVILNMHLHWKKHETVTVICKPCKPGQVHEYAREIARLSGGTPIQVIGDDTIVFYRGRNYVQPQVMSPIDTLSKKKALEKSKYEQSLETVRHFIEISEKELELYHRHVALYRDPQARKSDMETENLSSTVQEREEQDGVNSETDSSAVSDSESISEFESNSDYTDTEEDGREDHGFELVSGRSGIGQWKETNL